MLTIASPDTEVIGASIDTEASPEMLIRVPEMLIPVWSMRTVLEPTFSSIDCMASTLTSPIMTLMVILPCWTVRLSLPWVICVVLLLLIVIDSSLPTFSVRLFPILIDSSLPILSVRSLPT